MANLNDNSGVGDSPDNSASAGTPEPLETAPAAIEDPSEEQIISDAPAVYDVSTDEIDEVPEDLASEMESAIKSDPNDSGLVKKLRDLVKVKYEDYAARAQSSPISPENTELLEGLFEFDTESGAPTTKKFAQSLAKRDVGLAEQALIDLSTVPVDETGLTLGHKFLQVIGLDPYKIEELRQYSRGELDLSSRGIVSVPENVPKEYAEAYKSLDEVSRIDVDLYLDSQREDQRYAALRILKDRQDNIQFSKSQAEYRAQQEAIFQQQVSSETEAALESTYAGVLNSLKTNPAYTSVKISSDQAVDTVVKDSIISQLNALGDPRSVLAKQAVKTFEAQGVKVDLPKIVSLMETIESATNVAINAESKGKLQNRDYSVQIREANAKKTQAVTQLIALGNKYFSQTLAKLSGVQTAEPAPKGGMPTPSGSAPAIGGNSPKTMTPDELNKAIQDTARSLQAAG